MIEAFDRMSQCTEATTAEYASLLALERISKQLAEIAQLIENLHIDTKTKV